MKKWLGFLLTFIWAEFSAVLFMRKVYPLFDSIFMKLFGKTFFQRGPVMRLAVIMLIAAVLSVLVWKLLSNQKMNTAVMIGCIVVDLVMLGVICANQTIRRDDYWEIHDARLYGFPGFISHLYLNFDGRFFSWFVKSLYVFFDPLVYINILLFVNILVLMAALFYLMKILAPGSSVWAKISAAFCLGIGMLFASSDIWEVWFWGSGTFVYGLGVTFVVWAAVLMIDLETGFAHQKLKTAAAALCLFCACGTSELNMASACLFSFMIFLLPRVVWKRRTNGYNAFLFIFTWVITIIVMLTSGNFKYAAGLSGNPAFWDEPLWPKIANLFLLVPSTLGRYFYSRIEYLIAFLVIVFLIGLSLPVLRVSGKAVGAAAVVLFLGACGSLSINLLVRFMPSRVVSIPLDWIFLGIALFMLWGGSQVRRRLSGFTGWHIAAGVAALSVFSIAAFFYVDNIGMVRDIRSAWIARDQVLSSLNGAEENVETCAIPVMGSGYADPSEDPTRDFNIVTAYYYGLPSVTADHLCAPFD